MRARLVVAAVLAVVPAARADDPAAAAKAEAKAAADLAAARDYKGAAGKFRAAFRLDPRPEYLCNVGVAYHRAKELTHAQIYLGECLRRGQTLDTKFLDLVRKALTDVEGKLRAGDFAPVDVSVKPEGADVSFSAFDPDETFVGSQVVWLPFGSHSISASAEGYVAERRPLEIASRTQQHVRFELERKPSEPSPHPVPAGPSTLSSSQGAPPPPVAVRASRSKVAPIIATAVTVAAGGAAAYLFVHAHSIMDSAGASTIDHDEYLRRIDQARTWQHASWALAAATGVGAVLSTILWVRASHETTVEVAPQPGGGTLSLSRTW